MDLKIFSVNVYRKNIFRLINEALYIGKLDQINFLFFIPESKNVIIKISFINDGIFQDNYVSTQDWDFSN